MTEKQPIPLRVVRLSGQPVRLAAVVQSAQNTPRQITAASYLRLPTISSDIDTNHEDVKLLMRQNPFRASAVEKEDPLSDSQIVNEDSSDLGDDDPTGVDIGETTLQLLSQEEVEEQGLQTVTMSNDGTTGGTTLVQYTHGSDGSQIFIPVHQLNSSNVMSFGSRSIVVATPSLTGGGTLQDSCSEESLRKRELRLLKNKEAAKECRRKKKEYVKCLENRVAVLENQNRTLIEELKSLKELYCQKDVHS